MNDNGAFSNLNGETAYNGSYWQGANSPYSGLVWTGDAASITSNWDSGITLNEDYVKEIVKKLMEKREKDKYPKLYEGPEIPKWTGFLPI